MRLLTDIICLNPLIEQKHTGEYVNYHVESSTNPRAPHAVSVPQVLVFHRFSCYTGSTVLSSCLDSGPSLRVNSTPLKHLWIYLCVSRLVNQMICDACLFDHQLKADKYGRWNVLPTQCILSLSIPLPLRVREGPSSFKG